MITPPPSITKTDHLYNSEAPSNCICDGCNGLFIHLLYIKCTSLERENGKWLCIHCRGKIIIKGIKT